MGVAESELDQIITNHNKTKTSLQSIEFFVKVLPNILDRLRSEEPRPEIADLCEKVIQAVEEEVRKPKINILRAYCDSIERLMKASRDQAHMRVLYESLDEQHAAAASIIDYYSRLGRVTQRVLDMLRDKAPVPQASEPQPQEKQQGLPVRIEDNENQELPEPQSQMPRHPRAAVWSKTTDPIQYNSVGAPYGLAGAPSKKESLSPYTPKEIPQDTQEEDQREIDGYSGKEQGMVREPQPQPALEDSQRFRLKSFSQAAVERARSFSQKGFTPEPSQPVTEVSQEYTPQGVSQPPGGAKGYSPQGFPEIPQPAAEEGKWFRSAGVSPSAAEGAQRFSLKEYLQSSPKEPRLRQQEFQEPDPEGIQQSLTSEASSVPEETKFISKGWWSASEEIQLYNPKGEVRPSLEDRQRPAPPEGPRRGAARLPQQNSEEMKRWQNLGQEKQEKPVRRLPSSLPSEKNVILMTEGLCKSFHSGEEEQHVLKDLSIEIYENDFTVIMGSSGSGKSTLLYALSGMDRPTRGAIQFFDKDIANLSNNKLAIFRRENCGFIFQSMFLLDNMSVLDNIVVSGLLTSSDRKRTVAYAKELLEKVGLTETIWRKFPAQLSGGENQRAAIVRALINKPRVVFADEPTGALNSASGQAVLDVLSDVNANGQSIVMVTHDLESARRGNRILYMRDGIIWGECKLGPFVPGDQARNQKLQDFLSEMGW